MRYILMPMLGLSTARPDVVVLPHDALAAWAVAVRAAYDACLVIDAYGAVTALSPSAAELLGATPESIVGQSLDESLHLVDFTDNTREASGWHRRIPPLIALADNTLSRGVMRLRRPDGHRLMLDAIAAPVHDTTRCVVGAVAFLSAV